MNARPPPGKVNPHPERLEHVRAAGPGSHRRLPCLATVTPAAAQTMAVAVEMLNVPSRSPPVPTTSRISRARVSASSVG